MSFSSGLHGWVAQPIIAGSFSALSLLLLVMVLLSVPGPVQGLYWFSMESPTGEGDQLRAGVMGWCWAGTSNCTYDALSDNNYLSSIFDVSLAYTVRTLVPAACYFSIVVVVMWVLLVVTAPAGYRVKGTEYLARHLYFNIVEVSVLCLQLFACLLAWMAYGFTQTAFNQLDNKSHPIKSGNAMETTAIAAAIAMIGFFLGAYGLHLRICESDIVWKEECAMMQGPPLNPQGIEHKAQAPGVIGNFRASRASISDWEYANSKRMSRMNSMQKQCVAEPAQLQEQQPVYEVEERVQSQADLHERGSSVDHHKHTIQSRSLTPDHEG